MDDVEDHEPVEWVELFGFRIKITFYNLSTISYARIYKYGNEENIKK
ncbi:MAG: hypothetical protein AAB639_00790 [Patescibacteria group bacterium]